MIWAIKNYKLISAAILLCGAVFLVWHYNHTINENKRLTNENAALNGVIDSERAAVESLERLSKKRERVAADLAARLDLIKKDAENENAPTAGVLRNAIIRLRPQSD
jgi:hypothetical protein